MLLVVFVFVAALECGDGAILGQPDHLLKALGLAEQRETAEETDQNLSHTVCRFIISVKYPPLAISSS